MYVLNDAVWSGLQFALPVATTLRASIGQKSTPVHPKYPAKCNKAGIVNILARNTTSLMSRHIAQCVAGF